MTIPEVMVKGCKWAVVPRLLAVGLALAGCVPANELRTAAQAPDIDRHQPLPSTPRKVRVPPAEKKDSPVTTDSLRDLETLRGEATDRQKMVAAKVLGSLAAKGDRAALDGLLEVLSDKDGGMSRVFAALGLRKSKSVEAVEPLIEIVRDQTLPAYLRQHAALTLGEIGDHRAIPTLLQALDDPVSPDVRFYAYTALQLDAFKDQVPQTPILLKILKDREQQQWRRARAALFLSRMGDETVVPALIELLLTEPRSPELSLNKDQGPGMIYAGVMNKQRNVRAKIALALGKLAKGEAVTPLLKVLNGATDDRRFAESARKALEAIEKRVGLDPFLASLKDADPAVRIQAALFLGRLGKPEAEGPLQEALKDEDAEVREKAAAALSSLRERPLPQALARPEEERGEESRDESALQTE
jgi:HEAT repeat protein